MAKRTLPAALLLVAIAALIAVWYFSGSDSPSARPTTLGGALERGQAAPAQVAPLAKESEDLVEHKATGERVEGLEVAASGLPTAALRGRVLPPGELPSDEVILVLALSESMRERELYAAEGPAELAWGRRDGGPEPTPSAAGAARLLAFAEVAKDGRFSLSLPEDRQQVHLALSGRYLLSRVTTAVSLPAEAEVHLSGELGAWFSLSLLPRASAPEASLAGISVTLGPDLSKGFSGIAMAERGVARFGQTDDAGRVEFRAQSCALACGLVAKPKEHAALLVLGIAPEPGQHIDLPLQLSAGAVVSGRVIDEQARPVAGAKVNAELPGALGDGVGSLRETESDADGHFQLEHVQPGRIKLVADKDGLRSAFVRLQEELLEGSELGGVELVMKRGSALDGVVRFADGEPAAGVAIEVTPDMKTIGIGFDPDNKGSSKSDLSGQFSVSGLRSGTFTLTASLELDEGPRAGHWGTRLDGLKLEQGQLDIVLEGLLELTGFVRDGEGEGVPEFTVTATVQGSGAMFGIGAESNSVDVEESVEGRFGIAGLRPATYEFRVRAPGYSSSEARTIQLPRLDQEELVFVLQPGASISGKVVDPAGQPRAGAKVALDLALAERVRTDANGGGPSSISDGQGNFLLEGLDVGLARVLATDSDYAASVSQEVDLQPGTHVEDLVLVLRTGGILTGEVLNPDGSPQTDRMVTVQVVPTYKNQYMHETDERGEFRFEKLEPGEWQVVVTGNFFNSDFDTEDGDQAAAMGEMLGDMKMTMATIVDGEETHVVLGAEPSDPVELFVHVTHAEQPEPGVIVSFVPEGAGGMADLKMGVADDEGRAKLELARPGPYLVTVQRSGSPGEQTSVEYQIDVPDVERHTLELELPGARISGLVRGPDGKPMASCRISLSTEDGISFGSLLGGNYAETSTNDQGVYELDYLRSGTYTVAAGGVSLGGIFGNQGSFGRELRDGVRVVDGEWVRGVDFRLSAPGRLSGHVTGPSGQRVAGAGVFIRDSEGRVLERLSFISSDDSGSFNYSGLAPGDYLVSARTSQLTTSEGTAVHIVADENSQVDLVLGAGTVLVISLTDKIEADLRARISVVDPEGHELAGMFSMSEIMKNFGAGFSSKEQRIGPLAPGTYRVRATCEDGRTVSKPVTLKGDPERKLKLRLK